MVGQELLGSLTLVLHLALAAGVTLHVLLTKRDVAASVSWIGIAWLSPVVGSGLYWLIGINRVKRRAFRLRRHATVKPPSTDAAAELSEVARHLHALQVAGWRITGRHAEPGNRLEALALGDTAYLRMIAAIESARQSIALSTYILRPGVAGAQFVAALAAAQARGVAVRVLIDGFGGGYFYSWAYRQLRRRGVPVARFLHSEWPWRMPFLNMRLHSKLLLIDGRLGFTGGLNIGDENLLATRPRAPVRDTHFEIEGPVVAQLIEAFAADWLFTTGETLEGPAWIAEVPVAGAAVARVISAGPDQALEKIEFMKLSAIATAQQAIAIVTPYFLPDERLVSALALAALRGVKVDIVLPARSNHRIVDWATRAHLRPLLLAGVRIWHQNPPFDHSKLMTVDATWSLVGSANWDMRSLRLNFELDVEIYDAAFAAELGATIERRLDHRLTVRELDARSNLVVLRDAAVRLLLPYL